MGRSLIQGDPYRLTGETFPVAYVGSHQHVGRHPLPSFCGDFRNLGNLSSDRSCAGPSPRFSLSRRRLLRWGQPWLAYPIDGKPLLRPGYPIRGLVPGYGYKSIKWLIRIDLVNQDMVGY